MKLVRCSLCVLLLAAYGVTLTSCSRDAAVSNRDQQAANTNSSAANSNSLEVKSPLSAQTTTGTVEVTSTPPGASVVLIANDEVGSEPQVKGVTPLSISDLLPGKYTVHIERYGYKYSQKVVTVKAGKSVTVNAVLAKG